MSGIDLPTDRPVVTICGAGVTSLTAARLLRERGYQAHSLAGLALAILGLLLSLFFVRETRPFTEVEAQLGGAEKPGDGNTPSFAQVLLLTSWKTKRSSRSARRAWSIT